jgi:Ca2+/H+ antiporter
VPVRDLLQPENALNWLLFFLPITLVLEYELHSGAVLIFPSAAPAIIPLAGLMGRATEHPAERLGEDLGGLLNASFGNSAEHSAALLFALKDKMDLAINIAVGSPMQVALFVAPLLVFLSYWVGPTPMDLIFTTFEVLAVGIAAGVMALVAQDGECHWMEGVQLLAVYVILGIASTFCPINCSWRLSEEEEIPLREARYHPAPPYGKHRWCRWSARRSGAIRGTYRRSRACCSFLRKLPVPRQQRFRPL